MATSYSSTNRSKSAPQTTENKSWLDIQRKPDGNVIRPHELQEQLKWPSRREQIKELGLLDRIQGSLFGLALGDSAGASVEFRPKEFMLKNKLKTMEGGGTWGLDKGQFTDDTSMALCLAISLIVKEDFVPYDQLVRYKWWFREGYMSSTGKCFDIGKATRESLEVFERRQIEFAKAENIPLNKIDNLSNCELVKKFDVDCSQTGVAGNGSLMRLAPIPLFFHQHPACAIEFCKISGQITHGDQMAYDACRYYGALIIAAINGETKKELLSEDFYTKHEGWFAGKPLHPKIMEIARGSYKNSIEKDIRGTGFVVQTLEAALWAFYFDDNCFRTGVLKAVNLGDDTDTTAAIYGQLAGAYYGFLKLPETWRQILYANKFLCCISEWILYEGQKWKPNNLQVLSSININNIKDMFHNVLTKQQNTNTINTIKPHRSDPPTQLPRFDSKPIANNNHSCRSSKHPAPFDRSYSTSDQTQHTSQYQTLPYAVIESPVSPAVNRGDLDFIFNALRPLQNVDIWIGSLGKEFEAYASIFRKKNIDSYWLLNHVNENALRNYGITNREHQQVLLTRINEFKRIQLNFEQILPMTK